jgi:hypothetical protein
MHNTISCSVCTEVIAAHWQLFEHARCQPSGLVPAHASAEPLTGLISAVTAERETIRQLEKRVRRRQRWIDRHSGRGHLWA